MAAAFGSVLGPCDVAVTLADNGMDVAVKAERKAVERRVAALVELFRSHNLVRLSVNGDEVAQREKPMVKVANSRLNLPSGSFLQATKRGEEVLVAAVMESLPRTKHILDLFSGVGTFTLPMASRARVTAYDLDKPAIAALLDAARNTQGLKPIEAQVRNLFTAPLTPQELKGYDCVVIDPPRAGAEAQVKALARSDVENLTYVSCDPTSFARDARILMEGGFSLESLAPIDQFKWTAHVELVGVFRR
jgi:23S rRNA (uracil1939-C5)-methyltransferase